MRRRYSKADKAEAVGLSEAIGTRPAADQLGIPESSIRVWRSDPDFAQLRAETKAEVAADVWAGFQRGVRRMVALLETTDDLGKVAIATGVLYDKFALMAGEATSRSEQRSVTDDLPEDHKRRIRDWIDSLPAAAGDPARDPG